MTEFFSEAQIQALIAVLELTKARQRADAAHLAGVEYFRKYRQEWGDALSELIAQGLLSWRQDAYVLTERGKAHAARLHEARPPIYYWYREYYEATRTSPAYAEFCERVFGRDFGQHGFSDMAQIDTMLARLDLGLGERVLELGCGNGAMAEYIVQETGAQVTGIDYIPEAIAQAQERAARAPGQLFFHVGDIGHLLDVQSRLRLRPRSFDALIAVDTLYFTGLDDTLLQMRALLAPGGRMAIFYGQDKWLDRSEQGFDPTTLSSSRMPLGQALLSLGLDFETVDFSRANYRHAQLKKAVLEELRPALEAEGNQFLFENRYAEARGVIRAFEAGRAVRYLYLVRSEA
jgi:SAM-dependent methyltransferase